MDNTIPHSGSDSDSTEYPASPTESEVEAFLRVLARRNGYMMVAIVAQRPFDEPRPVHMLQLRTMPRPRPRPSA